MTAYFLLLILLLPVLSIVWWTIRTGISPMPTSGAMRRSLDRLLPETIEGDILELGSGWGGLSFFLADRYPMARVVGVELSPVPFFVARLRLRLRPRSNLHFERRDFLSTPLGEPGLVVCYLYPEGMVRLKEALEAGLSGIQVVSLAFALPGWAPEMTVKSNDFLKTPVYLYRT